MLRILNQHFYFGMGLLLAAIVVGGFSQTIGASLIHPATPTPLIFYFHATLFASWVLMYILQTGLVQVKRVALHRSLGYGGLVIGACVPLMGVATAVVSQQSAPSHEFFAISLNDMLLFATTFWLAVHFRKKPAMHKRLMLICTCSLMGAPLARIPFVPNIPWAYVGVDLLIALGALHDYLTLRKVHQIFLIALPCIAVVQVLAIYLASSAPPFWTAALSLIF